MNNYSNIKNLLFACGAILLHIQLNAQVHAPAPAQTQKIAIVGGTAHLGTGEVIQDAFIAFDAGKITAVGKNTPKRDLRDYQIIHAEGQEIYPGFIAVNTNIGLVEIGAIRSTRDFREVGNFNPNVRALIAYNTDSEIIPTVKSMGVLLAQVTPEGGSISGSSSVVSLDAWNWEDAIIKADDGIHLNWPSPTSYNWRAHTITKNKNYSKQINAISTFFKEAAAYAKKTAVEDKNLRFEAMKPLFDQKSNLYIHANTAKAITQGVSFAEQYHLKTVIVGGEESWMITDFLVEHHIPIILNKTHRLPNGTDTDIDQPFKTPALLQKAGVTFCLSVNGGWSSWQARNLPFQAGQAVAYGLNYEAAIQSISRNTAQILGIEQQVGSIEVGKDATLFISEGDVLDMRTSKVTKAFIQGRDIDLSNRQKQLYEKFKLKYKQR